MPQPSDAPHELPTIAAKPAAMERRPHDANPISTGDSDSAAMFRAAAELDRYSDAGLIGAGGMGEVRAADDRATGRTVAVKTVRADQLGPVALRRFAREARIQAQLEHPSIVPVYDVGVDTSGALYFTMKRIRGESLARVFERLVAGDDEAAVRYSRRRLLAVLVQVALTVEYAHQRGVLHRDLKPSNIMLGEFGEVYVLDWGLADVRDSEPLTAAAMPAGVASWLAAAQLPLVDSSVRPDTASGSMLGTPGFAAPELIDHGSRVLDERADVYALGAILYEALTRERLHRGGMLGEVLGSTMSLDGARPSERAADVPPELDALCYRATRRDPDDRLPSAAAFARAIEAYLDGDRDLAERRRLADSRAAAAAATFAAARDTDDDTAARAAALRDVTTALGLDPEHAPARTTLVALLTTPPRGADAAIAAAHAPAALRSFRVAARTAMLALSTYLLYVPLVVWMGIRRPWVLATMAAAICTVIGVTYHYYRNPPRDLRLPWLHLAASFVALTTGTWVIGPFMLLPTVVIATGTVYLAAFDERRMVLVIATMLAAVFLPFALQLAGALPASYVFADNSITLLPGMTDLPAVPTITFLLVTHAVVIGAALAFVRSLRRNALDAERRLQVQAWQLAQIVPDDTRALLAADRPDPR